MFLDSTYLERILSDSPLWLRHEWITEYVDKGSTEKVNNMKFPISPPQFIFPTMECLPAAWETKYDDRAAVGIISHTGQNSLPEEEKLRKIIVIHQVWEEIKVGRWDIIGNVIIEQSKK